MAFQIQRSGRAAVVYADGEIVVKNRQELKLKVLDAIDEGVRRFAIDFTCVGYIDASGLGVLTSLSKKIREAGGELILVGLNDDLKLLFELTKLDTLFQVADAMETVERVWDTSLPWKPIGARPELVK